jgi:hypothetical protein
MLFKESPADSQGWRNRPKARGQARSQARLAARLEAVSQPRQDEQPTHVVFIWSTLIALLTLLGSPLTRQWLATTLGNICVLGGILAAPVVSVVAWIGLLLPSHALLHQLAPALVITSLVWFGLAIAGAHAFRLNRRDDA